MGIQKLHLIDIIADDTVNELRRLRAAHLHKVVNRVDRMKSTMITTQARWLMQDWLFNKIADEYALSFDWDDRWRTGGNFDEVIEEAHLSPDWVKSGNERFANDREARLQRLSSELDAVSSNEPVTL